MFSFNLDYIHNSVSFPKIQTADVSAVLLFAVTEFKICHPDNQCIFVNLKCVSASQFHL